MTQPGTTKVLALALVLLLPAGFGVATVLDDPQTPGTPTTTSTPASTPDDAPSSPAASSPNEPDAPPTVPQGEVVESYETSFDEPMRTGVLDLRIDHGAVRVVGWDRDAYKIVVLQEPTQGAEANDFEVTPTFDDASQGTHVDLSLSVVQDGTYGVGTQVNDQGTQDPTPEIAIFALVPSSASYEEVTVCSGHTWMLEDRFDDIDWWPFSEEEVQVEGTCTGPDDSPGATANLGHIRLMNGSHDEGLNVTFGVENLHGDTLQTYAEYEDLHVSHVDFAQAAYLVEHGDVEGTHLAGANHTFLTEYGDIDLAHVAAADLQAWSNHGDLTVDLVPQASGTVSLLSDYGDATVEVQRKGSVGVQLGAGTDHGDIVVQLQDASVERQKAADGNWRDPSHWTGWLQEDDTYERTATAETRGFAAENVQLTLQTFTESGDVVVTDGSEPVTGSHDED